MGFFLSRVEKKERKSLAAAGTGLSGPTLEVNVCFWFHIMTKYLKLFMKLVFFSERRKGAGGGGGTQKLNKQGGCSSK